VSAEDRLSIWQKIERGISVVATAAVLWCGLGDAVRAAFEIGGAWNWWWAITCAVIATNTCRARWWHYPIWIKRGVA